MDDVKSLGNRISQFFDTNNDSEKLLPILKGENYPFTWREARKILEMVGKDGTVGDLRNALESPFPFETLTEKTFGKLVSLLETPAKDWEAIYTGRKFQKPIIGAYNEEITDRKTFRPWVDQQELLQVFQEMKNPFPEQEVEPKKLDHYFYEVLSKIVVKKHLMRSLSEDEWRVGALIPSPYKNDRGETIYYRVDQGVDSGHGKMWYVFRPACEDDDRSLPVIRVPRDTTPDDYAMRGGPTISRDLAEHAGSLYSSTTLQEDKAFFREFTLPVWMGYLAVAKKSLDQVSEEGPFDSLISHLNHVHRAIIEEISGQILLGTLAQNEGEKILRGLKKLLTKAETPGLMQLSAIKDYVAATLFTVPHEKDDLHRLTELAQGRAPRPFASVGNSLGGFDAQNDLLRHTFGENRIPITRLDLYTHSTLKIDQKDDDLFTDFILTHKDLLLNLDVHLSFQHVTELDDIVSLVTDGTFLGRGLQLAAKQTEEELPADVSLRVFIIIPFSESEEIQEKDVHFRRIEHLEKGKDFILLGQFSSIREYDNYARSYQFQGRRLESWRTMGIQLNLSGKSDTIWRISRFFSELRHPIPKKNTNDKLVVSYNPEGKQQHTFVLVHLTPELDKIFYRPVEVNLAV